MGLSRLVSEHRAKLLVPVVIWCTCVAGDVVSRRQVIVRHRRLVAYNVCGSCGRWWRTIVPREIRERRSCRGS